VSYVADRQGRIAAKVLKVERVSHMFAKNTEVGERMELLTLKLPNCVEPMIGGQSRFWVLETDFPLLLTGPIHHFSNH
jgi:hypothetical protein